MRINYGLLEQKRYGKVSTFKKVAYEKVNANQDDIVIQIKGSYLIKNNFPQTLDVQQLIYIWQSAICSRITAEIGKNLSLALTDDTITMVENSELEGFKEKNIIGCLVERLKRKVGKIELDKPKMENPLALLERYQQKKIEGFGFLLMILMQLLIIHKKKLNDYQVFYCM